jgi:hypothetical protein
MARKIIKAGVIAWERSQDTWGVAVLYDDHTRETWPVGDRQAATREIARHQTFFLGLPRFDRIGLLNKYACRPIASISHLPLVRRA